MAFEDNPIVDKNSETSEESVLVVKHAFSRKNGFISREEIPDYGCDLDVELINNSIASSKKFAIQIKSSTNFTYLKNDPVVSLDFKTSRLGYLCRRIGYGLVVIYDEVKKITLFEYVENIVLKLRETRNNDEWKRQESVKIHIPIQNILNELSVKAIHEKFWKRHQNLESLITNHGASFGIPVLEFQQFKDSYNEDPNELFDSLKKYGLLLVNSLEFKTLIQLINKIPFSEILSSNELLLLSAIAYTEMGKLIDAQFFINKCLSNRSKYSKDELLIIEFSKAKADFSLGNLDNTELNQKIENLLQNQRPGTQNYLTLKVNLLYSKVTQLYTKSQKSESEIKDQLDQLFDEINSSDINPRMKFFLLTFQADNFHGYSMKKFIQEIGDVKVKEKMGILVSPKERLNVAKQGVERNNISFKYFLEAYNYAKAENDSLLMAHTLKSLCSHFFTIHFNLIVFNDWQMSLTDEALKHFQMNFNNALYSFKLFTHLEHIKEAHTSLTFAFEIKRLFELSTGKSLDGISINEIQIILNNMEANTGIKQFKSVGEDAFNSKDEKTQLKDIPEEEEEMFAREILKNYDIPDTRLSNIISDIKTHKIFHNKCKNENIQLLQNLTHLNSKITCYAQPPKFILVNKQNGKKTNPNSDINILLKEMNDIL